MPKPPLFMKWLLLLLLLPVLACGAAVGDCACASAVHHDPCPAFCTCDHEAVLNHSHSRPCTHKPNPMVRVATATPTSHGHTVVLMAAPLHLRCRQAHCSPRSQRPALSRVATLCCLRPLRL